MNLGLRSQLLTILDARVNDLIPESDIVRICQDADPATVRSELENMEDVGQVIRSTAGVCGESYWTRYVPGAL